MDFVTTLGQEKNSHKFQYVKELDKNMTLGIGKTVTESDTGLSKIKGAKLGKESSVRADWLCIGWPFCQAELRREFQTG